MKRAATASTAKTSERGTGGGIRKPLTPPRLPHNFVRECVMTKRTLTWAEKMRPRCGYCNRVLPRRRPGKRGRPAAYCCRAHRQLAYESRRAREKHPLAAALLRRDIDDFNTKAGIERAVLDALRKFGVLPPVPKKVPRLRLVHDDRREKPGPSAD